MAKIYDADIIPYMYEDYKYTGSLRKVGETYICSYMTVRNYFVQAGLPTDKGSKNIRINVPMLFHDWQAGVKAKTIITTYGFKCRSSLTRYINKLRKQGWNFNYRCKRRSGERMG